MTHLAALALRPQNFFGPRQKYMPITALRGEWVEFNAARDTIHVGHFGGGIAIKDKRNELMHKRNETKQWHSSGCNKLPIIKKIPSEPSPKISRGSDAIFGDRKQGCEPLCCRQLDFSDVRRDQRNSTSEYIIDVSIAHCVAASYMQSIVDAACRLVGLRRQRLMRDRLLAAQVDRRRIKCRCTPSYDPLSSLFLAKLTNSAGSYSHKKVGK